MDIGEVLSHALSVVLAFLPKLLFALLILVAGYILTKVIVRPIRAVLKRSRVPVDEVAAKYILRIVNIIIWALAIVMALDKIGAPVTSLLTVVAAVGAAVALAVKDNLASLASGIVLLFSRPFKAGDFIDVDGVSGTITEIEMMHTYLNTVDNTRIAVPNAKMMSATIRNFSAMETRRLDLVYSVGYECDIDQVKKVLLDLAQNHNLVLCEPAEPCVLLKEYADSSINFTLRMWCLNADYWTLTFDMNEKVKKAFDENGISIPFPQMDVHMHTQAE